MSLFRKRVRDHAVRISRELGARVRFGPHAFRAKGYISSILFMDDTHEPHLLPPLKRALAARQGAVVDVGMNLGQTLGKILSIDPGRRYVGFEPQLEAAFLVARFLSRNGLHHMTVAPVGLSDRNGFVSFYAVGGADVSGSMAPPAETRPGARRVDIMARVGDEALAELGVAAPAVIKIDVEGAELQVLKGLEATISAARPVIFLEVLPNFTGLDRRPVPAPKSDARRAAAAALYDFLSTRGYDIRQIDHDGGETSVAAFVVDDPIAFVSPDYVAWPKAHGRGGEGQGRP